MYNQNPLFMTIRRYALALVLGVFSFVPFTYGQLTLTASQETAAMGATVDVDVTVENFQSIGTFQFTMEWDSTVVEFAELSFVNPEIDDPNNTDFGLPPTDQRRGVMTAIHTNPDFGNGSMIDDGGILFTLRFNVVGEMCDSTSIVFSGSETGQIGYALDDFAEFLAMDTNPGYVTVEGSDCGGGGMTGGSDDLTTEAADEVAGQNEMVCVPIRVQNFEALDPAANGVGSGQGDITWDPTIIQFEGIENNALPSSFIENAANTSAGLFKFVWFASTGVGITLDDNDILFEVCFTTVGNPGDVSPVDLVDWEWTDDTDNSNDLVDVEIDGSVTIQDTPDPVFTLTMGNEAADMNEEVCVDITTINFTDLVGLEHRVSWDATVLSFGSIADDIRDRNIDGFTNGAFNYTSPNNFFTVSWNSPNGGPIDAADGTSIYKVCFDVVGDCGDESPVQIIPNGGSTIIVSVVEGGVSSNLPASRIQTNDGLVSVECPGDCSLGPISGACPGEASGSVVTVVDADAMCQWTDAAGQVVSVNCNLLGVEPGTYDLTVTYPGSTCTLTAVVPSLAAPTISGTTTDAGCAGGGSISATISGDPGATFSWTPDLGNTLTPTGVDPGNYTLNVTGSEGCDASETFSVGETIAPLSVTASATDALCNGDLGSILLTISGGCEPYDVVWNVGTLSGTNPSAGAGTYEATVTDDNGTVATASATIGEPDALVLVGTPMVTNSTGSDGSITVEIDGGTEPYTYAWTPTQPNSNSISGLAPGDYALVVTDANDCVLSVGTINVADNSSSDTGISVQAVGEILCFGDSNGSITVSVTGMNFPGTLVLSGVAAQSETIAASSNFTFGGLGAGDYTITFSDSAGEAVSESVTLGEPDALVFDMDADDIGCDNDSQCDGFIDVQTEGGTGVLSYEWSDPNITGASADGLCEGTYTVMVTDQNGCQIMESFDIESCFIETTGCYEFPRIITPNGDGRNDIFNAGCLRDFPASLSVFDRWGRTIFQMDSYDGSWNGVDMQGADVIEGGYMWVLDIAFPEGRRELMKGTVTVLRD